MDSLSVKQIMIGFSVVLVAVMVAVVSWTVTVGTNIMDKFNTTMTAVYSDAGLSKMINSKYLDNLDSANTYKLLSSNMSVVKSYEIRDIDKKLITNPSLLAASPLDRYKVVITGNVENGFNIKCTMIEKVKVGAN